MTPSKPPSATEEHRSERVAVPGQWRVFREDGCVMLEVYPSRPIVVCTDTKEVE